MNNREVVFSGLVKELPKPEGGRPSDKKLENKLYDDHMNTMYDLFEELLDRDEEQGDLTEREEKFVDALIELHEFWDSQEEK